MKWTTLDLCLVLSESDVKLYATFEFCEGKNHTHQESKVMKSMSKTRFKHLLLSII
jgi:hypothetical protein